MRLGLGARKLVGWLLLLTAVASPKGRCDKQAAAIDLYCRQLRQQFQETTPFFFSGPDPWAEVSELPPEFRDAAVAAVYVDGRRTGWVSLDLSGDMNKDGVTGWFEKVDYYFDGDGKVVKQERHLEHTAANIVVDEARYYDKGRACKVQRTHHPLAKGQEDWAQLFDPEAPEYFSTRDLPFPPIAVARQHLAWIAGAANGYLAY